MSRSRRRDAFAVALVGAMAFLPFLRGVLSGASLYFRDLALYFLPLRRLALEALRSGDVPFWNPYVHEGVPLTLPGVGYPVDLLQLLRPDEVGISLVLALHLPLAAVGFYSLCRKELELPPAPAVGGALVYALGGFLLSTVNLYVVLQAAAWAPFVVLTLTRTTRTGDTRSLSLAALVVAVALSTTGVEVVGQALVVGVTLGLSRGGGLARRLGSAGAAVGLGLLLASPVLLVVASQVEGSARSHGFTTDVVLAHSVHPFTLAQVIVGGLYGNLGNLAGEWWGQNFFPRGFPYILSLYLGAAALAVAAVGAARGQAGHPLRARLVVLVVAGLVLGLGRWAGLAPVVDAIPAVGSFRYPVKAFFTVHLCVALLVALGLSALSGPGGRRTWLWLAWTAGLLGGILAASPALPFVVPGLTHPFSAAFFPPGTAEATRDALLSRVLKDAAAGGGLALAAAAVALAVLRGGLGPGRAVGLTVALLGADLLRTGAGLNPMVDQSFYRPSPELADALPTLREGRVFTCGFETSHRYHEGRLTKGTAHEPWTFGVALETLTPDFNVPLLVPTALSQDLTMLVPEERVASPTEASCRDLDTLLPRLRGAAVTTVLSLDPLSHPELRLRGELRSERTAPVGVHVYDLIDPRPRLALSPGGPEGVSLVGESTDRLVVKVETDAPAQLVVRDGWAKGWRARVNGEAAAVRVADGHHRAVPVPAGRSKVVLSYHPPGLAPGLGLSFLGVVGVVALALARRRRGLVVPGRWPRGREGPGGPDPKG